MSGTKRCKEPKCTTRIPSDVRYCHNHDAQLQETVQQAAHQVMADHSELLKRLAEQERTEHKELWAAVVAPNMTLPTDSGQRKEVPLLRGCLRYFPAALAGVARISKAGNDKHNPGELMYHARGKSMDHGDCILRHLVDVQDLLADLERNPNTNVKYTTVLEEVSQLAWRALALSQELHEQFGKAPLAPGAKSPD